MGGKRDPRDKTDEAAYPGTYDFPERANADEQRLAKEQGNKVERTSGKSYLDDYDDDYDQDD